MGWRVEMIEEEEEDEEIFIQSESALWKVGAHALSLSLPTS
jgi:hypothetical protein